MHMGKLFWSVEWLSFFDISVNYFHSLGPFFIIDMRSFLSFRALFFKKTLLPKAFHSRSQSLTPLHQFPQLHLHTIPCNFLLSFSENQNCIYCTVWPMILCKLVMSLTIPKIHHCVIFEKNPIDFNGNVWGFLMEILNPIRFEKTWVFFYQQLIQLKP